MSKINISQYSEYSNRCQLLYDLIKLANIHNTISLQSNAQLMFFIIIDNMTSLQNHNTCEFC